MSCYASNEGGYEASEELIYGNSDVNDLIACS
jgi:hypothetical protein